MKKVDPSKVRDRSAALVPGSNDTGPAGSGLPPAGASGGGGGLSDALAAALAQRKQKVSASGESLLFDVFFIERTDCEVDDEADDDDEW